MMYKKSAIPALALSLWVSEVLRHIAADSLPGHTYSTWEGMLNTVEEEPGTFHQTLLHILVQGDFAKLASILVHQRQDGSPAMVCCLQERPALWSQITDPEEADDGLEHFVDAPDAEGDAEAGPSSGRNSEKQPDKEAAANSGGTSTSKGAMASREDGPSSSARQAAQGGYDMRKRCAIHHSCSSNVTSSLPSLSITAAGILPSRSEQKAPQCTYWRPCALCKSGFRCKGQIRGSPTPAPSNHRAGSKAMGG